MSGSRLPPHCQPEENINFPATVRTAPRNGSPRINGVGCEPMIGSPFLGTLILPSFYFIGRRWKEGESMRSSDRRLVSSQGSACL